MKWSNKMDTDYVSMRMSNCFSGGTKFVTAQGVRAFNTFTDGEEVEVIDKDGCVRPATVKYFGTRDFDKITLKNGSKRKHVYATSDHRWILDDGSVTTNLKEGDILYKLGESKIPEIETKEDAFAFAVGFAVGDGADYSNDSTVIRLCGNKSKYKDIFVKAGFTVRKKPSESDEKVAYYKAIKQNFINGKGWRYMSTKHKILAFYGYYCADGSNSGCNIATTDERLFDFIEETSSIAGYHISYRHEVVRDTQFKKNSKLYYYGFIKKNDIRHRWKVEEIQRNQNTNRAWCVIEPITHSFVLADGVVTGNCELINIEDMLQNGTIISGVRIDTPKSLKTAATVVTQISQAVASSSFGGQSINLAHIAPFVDVSRQKYIKEIIEEFADAEIEASEEKIKEIAEKRLRKEIKDSVQTMQYQWSMVGHVTM